MLIRLLQDTFQATIHCIDYVHSGVHSILICYFVFDYNISYYNTFKLKKELFVFVLLSFFITLINLVTQIQGAQTRYTVISFGLNQPLPKVNVTTTCFYRGRISKQYLPNECTLNPYHVNNMAFFRWRRSSSDQKKQTLYATFIQAP